MTDEDGVRRVVWPSDGRNLVIPDRPRDVLTERAGAAAADRL